MKKDHEYSTPRDLYEKLVRDDAKLQKKLCGDTVFNFISTAYHLQQWVRNSPLINTEVMKRIIKRVEDSACFKNCGDMLEAKKHFRILISEDGSKGVLLFEDEEINIIDFKNEILDLYGTYFKIKGQ